MPEVAARIRVRHCAVSRVTPDKFLAVIVAHKSTIDAAVDNETWAVKFLHRKACGASLEGGKRAALIVHLKRLRSAPTETGAAARKNVGGMATPAAVVPVARQETEVLRSLRALSLAQRCASGLMVI